ncbi:hypothetical protein I547_0017 [Mycobacterium kansasii 824]|uniref:Uncharacterized protein n=1 Tax=Mycobacterium kansasii TaxID=1768 RepID=A0A1V3XTD7_MYCKA|nr:hypothetical protein I547_0017 [Mycobacterium kansasii 824]OOK82449.1 hypothetical protein BZL30_0345 [Mycobacterium kansasii]OOK84192.1 hypothetical protein BZL29_1479 [Mycobacterium kansasii]
MIADVSDNQQQPLISAAEVIHDTENSSRCGSRCPRLVFA